MTRRFSLRKIGILLLVVFGLMILGLFSQLDDWKRDLSINHASLDEAAPNAAMHPPIIDQPVDQIAKRIIDWAENESLWSVESNEASDDGANLHLTRTTRVFRWVDDIHVKLSKVDGGVKVDAESKSRTGKADFGQNPRNLRELVAGIQ